MNFCRALIVVIFCLNAGAVAAAPDLEAHDAWVRAAPPGATVLAAYLTIENNSARGRVLRGVSSPRFERVEMHRSELKDGVATMSMQAHLAIAAHARLQFTPSAYHLMLIGPRQALHPGDSVVLQLHFDGGVRLPVRAVVRADTATIDAPASHAHSH
ncbi:MAG: copper chaperone PCu(A)C [Gammaproteobacteria bacterium]